MSECIYCGKDEDDGVELIESDSPNDYFCNECLSNFEALNAINAKLRARVAELERQVESMRCCGNCANNDCIYGDEINCIIGVELENECDQNGPNSHWVAESSDAAKKG